jgi:hypothetical protein
MDTFSVAEELASGNGFTAYQTTSVFTPSSCRVPFFETRRNTLPSVTGTALLM